MNPEPPFTAIHVQQTSPDMDDKMGIVLGMCYSDPITKRFLGRRPKRF